MTQSLLVLALAAAPVSDTAKPLAPSSKWLVDYADHSCILQRDFGEGDAKMTFGIRPSPLGSTYEIVAVTRETKGKRGRWGTGQIWLSPEAPPVEGNYSSVRVPKADLRVTSMYLASVKLASLASASTIRIEAGDEARLAVAPTGWGPALNALEKCQADLVQGYGIDPAALAAIAKPAEYVRNPVHWISSGDYPSLALRANLEGVSSILWTIGIDGSIANCKVLQSSGHAVLDNAACGAIMRRGRYRPALDRNGKPTRSWDSRRVRWSVP